MRKILFIVGIAAVFILPPMVAAQKVEFSEQSVERVEGKISELGVEFSSRLEIPSHAAIEVRLISGTVVRAEIDYDLGRVIVQSLLEGTSEPAPLGEGDSLALTGLLDALTLEPMNPRAEALARMLAFVAVYPPGSVIEVDSASVEVKAGQKTINSLCSATGKRRSGSYNVKGKVFSQTVQLGPCYNESNECIGRCGPGCKAPPVKTFQVFTQDCLNHDLCTRKTGTILGECADEWRAAADDFLIGKDCGDLDGKWKDNFNYSWELVQGGLITGTARGAGTTAHCLPWSVSGVHSAENISLTASRVFQNANCCRAFTLTGKATSCSASNGTWTNVCGLSGTWRLSRQGKESVLEVFGEEDEPGASPGTADH